MAAVAPRWGWHQLDAPTARQLVAASGVGRGDLVLDVGAGTGALTRELLAAGARVVAVEAHPGRARVLRRSLPDALVVEADARDLRLPRRPFHVVSNPPFDATSALLRRLLQRGSRLVSADIVLQEQAVRRWASGRAPAAARWQREFHAVAGRRIPRTSFTPPPRVPAQVLRIRRAR